MSLVSPALAGRFFTTETPGKLWEATDFAMGEIIIQWEFIDYSVCMGISHTFPLSGMPLNWEVPPVGRGRQQEYYLGNAFDKIHTFKYPTLTFKNIALFTACNL